MMNTHQKEIIQHKGTEVHIIHLAGGPLRLDAFTRWSDGRRSMLSPVVSRLYPRHAIADARAAALHFCACLNLPTCTEAAARRGQLLSPVALAH